MGSRDRPIEPEAGSAMLALCKGQDVAQVVDAADDDNYRLGGPVRKAMVEIGGYSHAPAVACARIRHCWVLFICTARKCARLLRSRLRSSRISPLRQ